MALWVVFQLACGVEVRLVKVGAEFGLVVECRETQIVLHKFLRLGHVEHVPLVKVHCCSWCLIDWSSCMIVFKFDCMVWLVSKS